MGQENEEQRGLFCEILHLCCNRCRACYCFCKPENEEIQHDQRFTDIQTSQRQPAVQNPIFDPQEQIPPSPAPRPEPNRDEQQKYEYANNGGNNPTEEEIYFEESGQKWHVFHLTRQECDQMLKSPPTKSGKFLIRNSLSRPGKSALAVLDASNAVHHYIIFEENRNYFIERGKCFKSFRDLVLHYKEHDVCGKGKLSIPCTIPRIHVPHDVPQQLDKLVINRINLKEGGMLGKGKFGVVKRGKLLNSFDVAIKQAKQAVNVQDFMEEAAMLAKLQHRRIVQLYGVVNDAVGDFLIVTELMIHGDLLKYMRRLGDSFEYQDQITVMIQVVDGMAYLEEKKVIHRDLRAANVLVGENSVYKIGDLGLAKLIDNQHCNIGAPFPVRWTAPEVLQFPNNDHTHKSDVWSFGVLLYEIATRGGEPWKGLENHEVKRRVVNGNFLEKPDDCDELLYSLMTNCWGLTVEERPTFSNLKELLLGNYGHQDEPNFANEQQPRDLQS